MQVAILAGGMGVRLRPITEEIPKPMVEVDGKPFLFHQLNYLKKQEYRDFIILSGYLGHKIQEYFGDGSSFDLRIKYSQEDKLLGTGGALKKAESFLDEKFFVIYGDSFLSLDYRMAEKAFIGKNKMGMIVVYNNSLNTDVKNNVAVDENLMVTEYDKDDPKPYFKYVEAGVLAFRKEILKLVKPAEAVSLEKTIYPELIKKKELAAYPTKERFYDIGTTERLNEFRKVLE